MAKEEIISEARESLLTFDKGKAEDVAKRGLAAGLTPQQLMSEGFVVGIRDLGEQFDRMVEDSRQGGRGRHDHGPGWGIAGFQESRRQQAVPA